MPWAPPSSFQPTSLPPQMLNPPGQWAHWCWQDVRVQTVGLGAALQSVVASPSAASWAGGRLAAFPDGSEPSAGPWPGKEEWNKKG